MPWLGPQAIRFMHLFPTLDYQVWVGLLILNFYWLATSWKLRRVFAAKEIGAGGKLVA